jgi:Helix-turn-helix domain
MEKQTMLDNEPLVEGNSPPGYCDDLKTAKRLRQERRTLRDWRRKGEGPPYVRIGRKIFYNNESLAAWLKQHEIQPVRECTA